MMMERLRAAMRAETWQLDYLFDLSVQAWIVHIGVVTAVFGIFVVTWPDEIWPFVWYAAICLLSILLALLARRYIRDCPADEAAAQPYGVAHTALTTLVGIVWGLGAFGAATGEFQYLLVYSLALGGTALGAISSQHVLPRSCFISIWTSIPLLAAAHLFHNPDLLGVTIAVMILLYGGVLSILAIRMLRFMRTNVMLTRSLDARLVELTKMAGELEDARHDAVEANYSKSRFLAHASHDLRQPVHAIGLFTACLRDLHLGTEAMQHVNSIDNAARSVSRLLGSLLDISRLDVALIVPQPERMALGDFLRGLVRQNANAADESGCDIELETTDLWVNTDPTLLSAMIQNILSNALKYAPGSKVRIAISRNAIGCAAITIADNGPGISDDDLPHIFDEFYRADDEGARKMEGLGLGLAIVQRLAGLMDLDVAIESAADRGTTLRIGGLHIVEAGSVSVSRAHREHPLTGLNVCVIDDDPEVLAATATLLRRWGCEVVECISCPDSAVGCDAIASDFDLGGPLDGPDAIAALRTLEGWDVPAAIVTGRSEPETLMRLVGSGIP
ncbi:MAG: hybrid sensor histidine kinase/response regulator, partial [Parvibaculum sp.]|nr:hybrid sensor histidine kinase/response regulator [Parvibaculum sp.]